MANISVLLPVMNGAATITETLDSLVAQSYKDFNLILINDGSSDNTIEIVEQYKKILNINIISNKVNLGISKSLNSGIKMADCNFIARIDADDIAHPYRFQKQIEYMENNKEIDISGTSMLVFQDVNDNDKKVRKVVNILNHPTEDAAIKTSFLQFCSIAHPSLICKRETFESYGNYNHEYDNAEDYELWTRVSMLGAKFSNIPENLTFYRQHSGQIGQAKLINQLQKDLKIKNKFIESILSKEIQNSIEFFFSLIKFNDKVVDKINFSNMLKDLFEINKVIWDVETYMKVIERSYQRHILN
jgi:glycosyltransferase involved in cell wall biosynthesis